MTISDNPCKFIVSCLPVVGDLFSAVYRKDSMGYWGLSGDNQNWLKVADFIRCFIIIAFVVAVILCPALNFLIIPVCTVLFGRAVGLQFSEVLRDWCSGKCLLMDLSLGVSVVARFVFIALFEAAILSIPVHGCIALGFEVVHLISASARCSSEGEDENCFRFTSVV